MFLTLVLFSTFLFCCFLVSHTDGRAFVRAGFRKRHHCTHTRPLTCIRSRNPKSGADARKPRLQQAGRTSVPSGQHRCCLQPQNTQVRQLESVTSCSQSPKCCFLDHIYLLSDLHTFLAKLTSCNPPLFLPTLRSQRYFRGHNGKQITFLRVSPNGRFVASGEAGTRPTVRVWDAATSVEARRFFTENCRWNLISVVSWIPQDRAEEQPCDGLSNRYM